MAINTSTITQLISDFRALSQKDSISPESLGSRRKPRPQRLPQRQRQRKTCRIGRRPPRNIVPTRAELSLLKLCRVQPILCNTAPTAPTLSILSTSERKNFRIGKVTLSLYGNFVAAVNGETLASGLAVLVGEAGARSLASKTHRKNLLIKK